MPTVGLTFVKTGRIVKDVWRVCRETAERKTGRLGAVKTEEIVKDVWKFCREAAERETERLGSLKTEEIVKDVWRVCRETAERESERLSSLRTGRIVKGVCRVCRETTELETEGLCPDCARVKAQIRSRVPDSDRRTMTTAGECGRTGCVCTACGRRTIDRHPVCQWNPARAGRELHLHPRCHELWLEAVKGRPERA